MIISLHFIILFSYHVFTTVTHFKVCISSDNAVAWCSAVRIRSLEAGVTFVARHLHCKWFVVMDTELDQLSLTPLAESS